ncbi:hypothetical protein MOR33_004447 [Salmonella enterica]|nr:hypothetical protein [Salmonella enterica]EGL7480154.1 hypothetical protein [Salmonella enterica]EIZ2335434.1 hypothetical protein [Salmonella enterica]
MISVNSGVLGQQEEREELPDLAVVAGRFGLMNSGPAPVCTDLNRTTVGEMLVTPDTKNNPVSGSQGWGLVVTWDSLGAGQDGLRVIPDTGAAKEWITQMLMVADGSLYTRTRINQEAFGAFVKRW